MASLDSAQDIVSCDLCDHGVEFNCNSCQVKLCPGCVGVHMSLLKTVKHDISPITQISLKSEPVFPNCSMHDSQKCDIHCRDCHTPVCSKCIVGEHKQHDVEDLAKVLSSIKKDIQEDNKELQTYIDGKPKESTKDLINKDYDTLLEKVDKQGTQWQKAVEKCTKRYKQEIEERRMQDLAIIDDDMSKTNAVCVKAQETIKENQKILDSQDSSKLLSYESKTGEFKHGFQCIKMIPPEFVPQMIEEKVLYTVFGTLTNSVTLKRQHLAEPYIDYNIESGKKPVFHVQCTSDDNVWVSGTDNITMLIDGNGSILNRVQTNAMPMGITVHQSNELLLVQNEAGSPVYVLRQNQLENVVYIKRGWFPCGITCDSTGNIILSMRTNGLKRVKVVCYKGRKFMREIEYDHEGQPFFSVNVGGYLFVSENDDDIYVSDTSGQQVLGFNSDGNLKFLYKGNLSSQSKYDTFWPGCIVTNINNQIIIQEIEREIIHIINTRGQFVSYIDTCELELGGLSGLSVDSKDRLIVGEVQTGKIHFIQYLK